MSEIRREIRPGKDDADLSDLVLEATRRPLMKLEEVPVDREYADRLIALLNAHGASVSEQYVKTYERRGQCGQGVQGEYCGYAILFPTGTSRAYKLRLRTTTPFVIYFPDGFELHGAEVSLLNVGNTPTIILYLPRS